MRAQICFFVSIVFSFVAWGAVTGSLILPELSDHARAHVLASTSKRKRSRRAGRAAARLKSAAPRPTLLPVSAGEFATE
jgi:hypothetical protein